MRRVLAALGLVLGVAVTSGAPAEPAASGPGGLARLKGDWDGVLDAGALRLRIVLHVGDEAGTLRATIDSPDQNALGLPATVTLSGDQVSLSAQGAAGAFDGALSPDGGTLSGRWSGAPLTLARRPPGAAPAPLRRPQIPTKPYPYREEEVTFPNAAAPGVRLAGTLTLPQGAGPFPAVILIAGSGPQTRDEAIFGHPIFLVLADHLTRHGVAVLRYDKRGLGGSSGDAAAATSRDLASDAAAAVAFLRARGEIDPTRIGLVGHSEGGVIAPMVAGEDPKLAFLVLMAGSAVPGDRIIMAQSRAIALASGAPPAAVDANAVVQRRFLDAVMSAADRASAEAAARTALQGSALPTAAIDAQARAATSNWYRFFLSYDPGPALRRLRLPVLALIGSKDLQVPADLNLPAFRDALKADPDAEVVELPGLNHLFQTARTGAPSEYGEIEETMSPVALDTITRWIQARPGRSPSH